jgi:cystathionine beta-lyase/cystathionine gamma-synthase
MVDNSYCSPLYQRPIALGIDLVMQTATKYIGGHSDTVGGVLSGSSAMIKKIFDSEFLNSGTGIQPFNAWLLIRGLRTMPARLERIGQTTRKVAAWLKAHPRVEAILFPFDESFPQYALARQQMQGACGLLSFYVRAGAREEIVTFCESLKHIMMAVSWGGHESLILPKCASLTAAEFDPSVKEHRLLRLYTGLEEADYLIRDLEQAFLTAW